MPRSLVVAVATFAAACALAAPSGGRAGASCGTSPYAYAGLVASSVHYGVAATITPLAKPVLRGGHIAAWVGVGGKGQGPDGSDEWLQTGISVEPGRGVALYYELTLPGKPAKYVMLKGHLRLDRSYRLAVLESQSRYGSWALWLNGTRISALIHLPGSHGAWRPVATTESWNGGVGACNRFTFAFSRVKVAARPGGSWTPMVGDVLRSPGVTVARRTALTFVARGGE
jgi:hypothetical protein